MQAWHQQNLLEPSFPFTIFLSENTQFPPHWHGEMEIVYVLDGHLKVGLNHELFSLGPRDIFIIGSGQVHHFPPQTLDSRLIFIQFGLSFFDSYSSVMSDRRLTHPLLGRSGRYCAEDAELHGLMEKQIQLLVKEYEEKTEGYPIALKARLYDLFLLLLRFAPMKRYSKEEKRNQLNRLNRLEMVFEYVEEKMDSKISITEVAKVVNFSIYHFTRFFKAATGMTFGDYLKHFRIKKAEWYLTSTEDTITEIAMKTGFSSVQSFDRVFKELKGCSPRTFRSAIFDKY
ncbi:MAG TPA: AraC family transcriptional regulator [Bacillota bacterium]|nr:AraC family transcriptional regulator [Bacillota bacterium]